MREVHLVIFMWEISGAGEGKEICEFVGRHILEEKMGMERESGSGITRERERTGLWHYSGPISYIGPSCLCSLSLLFIKAQTWLENKISAIHTNSSNDWDSFVLPSPSPSPRWCINPATACADFAEQYQYQRDSVFMRWLMPPISLLIIPGSLHPCVCGAPPFGSSPRAKPTRTKASATICGR
jgi:hypothetical protein